MEIIKEINLNINQPNHYELINVMQGSLNSVRVIAHLHDGNRPYQIPDTVSAYQLLGILPSGKYLMDGKVSKYNATSVSFLIHKNMMAKPGYICFSISLLEDGGGAIVETFPAKIMVTAIPGQDCEQTDEIPLVTESLREVKKNAEIAAESAEAAKTAEANARNSETNARNSEVNAGTSEQNARTYADNAKTSESNAKASETNATGSSTAAAKEADNAAQSATNASASAATSAAKATESSSSATQSQSYAVGGTGTRNNENIDNSKYYYEQSRSISESFSGALRPMGTVAFADLPTISTAVEGDMYNISDQFTTTEDFKEGSGLTIPSGSNVYKTADGMWDVLAGSPVTGIKGNAETTYRKGNVNITPSHIGLGNVGNFKAVSTAASQGLSDTEKANARNNIGTVSRSGDTMTGNLSISHNSAPTITIKNTGSADTAFIFDRTTGANWRLLSSGGYLNFQNDWINNKKGNYATKMRIGCDTGNLELYNTSQPQVILMRTDSDGNTLRSGMLQVSAGNNFGLWDITNNKWMCYSSQDGSSVRFLGLADSATKWAAARNINGLSVQGNADRVNYGTCSTAAATAAKVVNCAGFALITGSEITVRFTVTNTAANPTLNVNNTGAKPVYYRGSAIAAGNLAANRTYTFRYNGTQYELVGDLNTDTTYGAATATTSGIVKLSNSVSSSSTSLAATANAVKTVNDKFTYKTLSTTGKNSISVSSVFSTAKEIIISLFCTNANGSYGGFTWHVTPATVPTGNTGLTLLDGYSYGSLYGLGEVQLRRDYVTTQHCVIIGQDYTTSSKLIINYR